MITTALFVLGWVVCGIFAYGIQKNNCRQFYLTLEHVGYDISTELLCIMTGIFGFYGFCIILGSALVLKFAFHVNLKLGLCYKMPKELLNSVRRKKHEAYMKQLRDETNDIKRCTEEFIASLTQRPTGRG